MGSTDSRPLSKSVAYKQSINPIEANKYKLIFQQISNTDGMFNFKSIQLRLPYMSICGAKKLMFALQCFAEPNPGFPDLPLDTVKTHVLLNSVSSSYPVIALSMDTFVLVCTNLASDDINEKGLLI